jgi:hypothetical protein
MATRAAAMLAASIFFSRIDIALNLPYTEGISVMLSYLKQYLVSLILIKSCKYEGLS